MAVAEFLLTLLWFVWPEIKFTAYISATATTSEFIVLKGPGLCYAYWQLSFATVLQGICEETLQVLGISETSQHSPELRPSSKHN